MDFRKQTYCKYIRKSNISIFRTLNNAMQTGKLEKHIFKTQNDLRLKVFEARLFIRTEHQQFSFPFTDALFSFHPDV